jgi:transcriptional regulator with PAS, ATPase and Fis domain
MEDVSLLANHFIQKHAQKRKDILIKGITEDAINILRNHSYPGNIRELENIIEHAISFANNPEILPSDLPSYILQSPSNGRVATPRLRDALRAFEKEIIVSALYKSGGNISRAASTLGIYRQQLQRKIKTLRIAT